MKSDRFTTRLITVLIVTALFLSGVFVGLKFSDAVPARAEAVTGYSTLQIIAANGVTQTAAATPVFVEGWGVADCYAKAAAAGALNTVTLGLWHGPNTADFTSLYTFTAQGVTSSSGASLLFTNTALYGSYLKGVATLANTNTIT